MAYCTPSDIYPVRISEQSVTELTDDHSAGQIDPQILTTAIEDATHEIDGYIRGRYALPLARVPDLILKLCCDITIYNLFSRRIDADIPEGRQARYDQATATLKRIQEGTQKLFDEPGAGPQTRIAVSNKSGCDRLFGPSTLSRIP